MLKVWGFLLVPGIMLALSGTVIGSPTPADAVGLFQMQHTVVQPGGEPVGSVLTVVQDNDGFLWLTTFKGDVLRFDGDALTRPFATQLKPFEAPITLLLGPNRESSDVWIGHRRNGLTHIVHGVATHYDGGALPGGSVHILLRDHNGVIWAMTPQGVARFVDGQWRSPTSLGWEKPHPEFLAVDAATGDVFALDADRGAIVSRGGTSRFEPTSRAEAFRADAGLAPGRGWPLPDDTDATRFADREGAIWFAPDSGVDRYRLPDVKERMTYAEGLSSPQVYGITEDREGDIWLATTRGLDRFRKTHSTPLVFPEPVEFPAIATVPDGSVWVTSVSQPTFRYAGGKLERVDALGDGVSAVATMADGSLLFAGRRGIQRWRQGSVTSLPLPKALEAVGGRFRQILEATDGTLWVVAATYGLYHVEGDRWTRMNGTHGLPAQVPSFVRPLPDGGIGIAYADAGLYAIQENNVRHVLAPDTSVGAPTDWLAEHDGMWVGGSRGLIHVGTDGMHDVRQPDGRPYLAVSGLLRDRVGALWIFHQGGIDRLAADAARRAAAGAVPEASLHINVGEGIGENAAGIIPASSLLQDASGHIWAATVTGVAYLDPGSTAVNAVRPKVFVDALVSDQKMQPAVDGSIVPALVHTLRIDYTAPMLRRPEQARFEYQLSGVDETWQHAGTRRSAYYTTPVPGTYTFRVRAFNEDGFQSASDAVLRFHVAPAWYQTGAFAAIVIVALALGVWMLYIARIRVVTRRLRIRTDERERIARDLHDTLLQGFQGLVLRFEAIRRHAGTEKAKGMIDSALLRADDVLVEGREKVTALRRSDADHALPGDLHRALESIGDERADLHPAAYRVVVTGSPRSLRSEAFENVVLIGREAVLNALQHANATTVTAELRYSRRTLVMSVQDDGQGFDQERGKAGHWGLLGMRERAAAIGATVSISSNAARGSAVTLTITATRAYL